MATQPERMNHSWPACNQNYSTAILAKQASCRFGTTTNIIDGAVETPCIVYLGLTFYSVDSSKSRVLKQFCQSYGFFYYLIWDLLDDLFNSSVSFEYISNFFSLYLLFRFRLLAKRNLLMSWMIYVLYFVHAYVPCSLNRIVCILWLCSYVES